MTIFYIVRVSNKHIVIRIQLLYKKGGPQTTLLYIHNSLKDREAKIKTSTPLWEGKQNIKTLLYRQKTSKIEM